MSLKIIIYPLLKDFEKLVWIKLVIHKILGCEKQCTTVLESTCTFVETIITDAGTTQILLFQYRLS